uniref:Uncharacterized protein n=1 Tax=Arundo donax TaxID=35708 RepID=A0A0A8Z3M6_ARUDO
MPERQCHRCIHVLHEVSSASTASGWWESLLDEYFHFRNAKTGW